MNTEKENSFVKEISAVINRYSLESESDTPDFILATYLANCLNAYIHAVKAQRHFLLNGVKDKSHLV